MCLPGQQATIGAWTAGVMMSRERWEQRTRLGLSVALALIALASAGCTSQLADLAEPAEAPARPMGALAFPEVNDVLSARDTRPLTAEERRRITDELTSLRARQEEETTGSIPPRVPAGR
jgi:hypothetical protein